MSYKNRRVLVTGGAGFIGSELVRQLAAQRARVVVVDSLVNGRRENLEELLGNQVELTVTDIRDSETLARLSGDIDILFHLACLGVRHSLHSPYENHEVNAAATLSLLLTARESGVKRFVYVSSSEVYGTARQVPMSEEHPTLPRQVYGAAKLAAECYARAFYESYNYPTVVVRPFNAYGPRSHHEGDCGEVIPKFLLRCLAGEPLVIFGDGKQTRDFTYVSDIAQGILTAGIEKDAVGQTINLGSSREISINDLAQEIVSCVGRKNVKIEYQPPRPADARRLYADTAKARKFLRFQPKVSLREGLVLLKEWHEKRGISPEKLLEQEVVRNWESPRSEKKKKDVSKRELYTHN